jgi:hypothetical protein
MAVSGVQYDMTTQTILCNLYDYGAATVAVTVHDPATLVLTDTANTVTKNGVNGSRYAAVFTRVSVLPAGVYAVGVVVNGVPGLLHATLAGVDGEVVSARSEIAAELDSATLQKIDQILEDTGTTLPAQIAGIEGGEGGGSATLEKQEEILAAIQGTEVIQVASPNVQGNLVLTQGDDYDGVANPRAQWNVTTDYTAGWTVRLTIRDKDDAVIYTNTGSVVSATVVAVTIAAPTGLEMTGCPGQWQGKFDVELTHSSGKKKTIALGVCYINEDQTR